MADGFSPLTQDKLSTPQGVADLNRMLEFLFNNTPIDGENVKFLKGFGTPEGAVQANVGSIFLRQDGGASTVLYIKESGTAGTGWIAK